MGDVGSVERGEVRVSSIWLEKAICEFRRKHVMLAAKNCVFRPKTAPRSINK